MTPCNRAPRQANVELLRIVAMAMVVVLHLNMVVKGTCSTSWEWLQWAIYSFVEALCIGAVNIFVMISGWFGIRPTMRSAVKLMWQVMWMGAMGLTIAWMYGYPPTWKTPLQLLGLMDAGWFVISYLMLMVLAPVLNAFVKESTLQQHAVLVLVFFIFQTLLQVTYSAKWICGGYGPLSFIGLYLLAGLLKRWLSNGYRGGYLIFLGCALCNATIYVIAIRTEVHYIEDQVFLYSNPIIIVGCCGLLLGTASTPVRHRRLIDIMGASAFAVYLLHAHMPQAMETFCKFGESLVEVSGGAWFIVFLIAYGAAIYVLAIVLDQPRKWLWRWWEKHSY